MKRTATTLALATLLAAGTTAGIACEFKQGETKFADYANCQYGEKKVRVINLPERFSWEQCIYVVEAFAKEKLLAVTKERDGKELLSINKRKQIGNPCYLTKRACDAAFKASQE